MATTVCLKARGQIVEDVAMLLPAGCDHGQHSLHEPAPVHTVSATADPTPDHGVSQGAFHRVVRRLDPQGQRALMGSFGKM